MLGMRENAFDHHLGVALLPEDRRAVLRVLVECRMDLVVEVVEERRDSPELLVLAELARIGANGGLDCEGVAEQRLALRVAGQRLPGLLA
jgi:hypothetical protein